MRHFIGLLLLSSTVFAASYTAETDFSITNGNPNGVWSYGYRTGSNPSFTAFSNTEANFAGNPGFDRWHAGAPNSGNSLYYLGVYGTAEEALILHPSNGSERAVLRFTAPQAGTWRIDAVFTDAHRASTTVEIQRSGDIGFLFSDLITDNTSTAYGSSITLAANQYVDFIVGNNGNHNEDSTQLQVTFSNEVPEPGTVLMLGAGLLALAAGRRRVA